MCRYYIVSGILLILLIIDFAIAAPVLVQENHQAGVDVVHIPEDAITMLGKRGDELDKLWLKLFGFAKPEGSSAARPSSSSLPSGPADGSTYVEQPLPSIPEEPSSVSSTDHAPLSPGSLTGSGDESMKWGAPPGPLGPVSTSTTSSADHELTGAHTLSNPGPSTLFDHEMVDVPPSPMESDQEMVDVPPSSMMSDQEMVDVSPPPGSASPIESDHEMVDVPPSIPVSSTNPERPSTSAGSSSGQRKIYFRPHKTTIF